MSSMETCHVFHLLSIYLGHRRLLLVGVISLFEMQEMNNYDWERGSWLIFTSVTFAHVIWHIQQSASATRNKFCVVSEKPLIWSHTRRHEQNPGRKAAVHVDSEWKWETEECGKKRAAGKLLSWRVCSWLRPMCSTFRRKTLRHRGSPCARTCVLLHSSRLRMCRMIMMSGRQVCGANFLKCMHAVAPSSLCVQEEKSRKRDDVTGIVLPVAPSPLCPTLPRGLLLR